MPVVLPRELHQKIPRHQIRQTEGVLLTKGMYLLMS